MPRLPYRTILFTACLLALIIAPFFLFGDAINAWTNRLLAQAAAHPWTTGALLTLLLATDILLPVPSSLASTACGLTLGFPVGAFASFLGMSLSTLAGYAIGCVSTAATKRMIGPRETEFLEAFHRRHGTWMLLALRPVPVLAEASVLFSGIARLSAARVLTVTAIGNAGVSLAYAAVGAWGRLSDAFLPAFAVSMALAGLTLLLATRGKSRQNHCSP